ncbi:MAG: DinB family protein [Acidimicrobiia bacterium]
MIERTEPPDAADERTMLTSFLDYYRATLLLKADGLSDEQARTPSVDPSDLSIMGLIRHMSEVERSWFQRWFREADAPPLYYGDHDEDGDLHPGPEDSLADAIAVFEREVELSRSITAAAPSLDDLAIHVSTDPGHEGFHPNLRWILVHMIEEYARHAGHADLLRERLDGVTGD